jgi:hypothetical protein
MTLIADYQRQIEAFADALQRRGNFLVYNLPTEGLDTILTLVVKSTNRQMLDFSKLARQIQAPRLPDMDDIVRNCYRRELERGRNPNNDKHEMHPLIVVSSVFDPSDLIRGVGRDPTEFYTLLRRLISDDKYNPGIRYILVEDPLLEPKISARKGTDNPLYGAVTYLNMADCQFSRELR